MFQTTATSTDDRERAAAVVSVALGETGAPWSDICPTVCSHPTCDAIRALLEAGLLREPDRSG